MWVGGGILTNLKSLNRIEISRFIKFLLTLTDFKDPPPWGGGGGWIGVGLCQGVWGVPHTCAHMHAHVMMS